VILINDLIDSDNFGIERTFESTRFIIPTRSQRPMKYFAKFAPLCSPETGWNPTTSARKFHLPLLTSIQWAVILRNAPLVLSAVQPSLVVAIFPGAAWNHLVSRDSSLEMLHCTHCDISLQLLQLARKFIMDMYRYGMWGW
jgi:hypothetical protein